MTTEDLLRAVGQIDDDLILEARRPVQRTVLLRRLSTAAAALVICAGILSAPHLFSAAQPSVGDDAKGQVKENAAGAVADDMAAPSQFHAESRAPGEAQASTATADKALLDGSQGAVEPRFITSRGTYLPIVIPGNVSPTLPVDAVSLGTLQLHPCDNPSVPTTLTESLVGCPVWESKDGDHLYVQHPTGWFVAALVK